MGSDYSQCNKLAYLAYRSVRGDEDVPVSTPLHSYRRVIPGRECAEARLSPSHHPLQASVRLSSPRPFRRSPPLWSRLWASLFPLKMKREREIGLKGIMSQDFRNRLVLQRESPLRYHVASGNLITVAVPEKVTTKTEKNTGKTCISK